MYTKDLGCKRDKPFLLWKVQEHLWKVKVQDKDKEDALPTLPPIYLQANDIWNEAA